MRNRSERFLLAFLCLSLTTVSGTVSWELVPMTRKLVGIDINPSSVGWFNESAARRGFAERARAYCIELKGEKGELADQKFDVITVSHLLSSDISESVLTPQYPLKPSVSLLTITSLISTR
jgi:hypothetical protein